MSDGYRDLHDDSWREWKSERADEFAEIQRRAFKAGFEAAADESQNFRQLRQWLEVQRDEAMENYEESGQEDDFMHIRAIAFRNVLVKLSEMGCMPEESRIELEESDDD
jgi:hypothetical protein